ncbi:MAG: hypothetical protein JWO31_400 [Phycisphaerales bacterium]|nr:hypothetical protein [Phycisphaerales bacterium]
MRRSLFLVPLALGAVVPADSRASVIFDDFNATEGHFSQTPTSSGQSNVAATSTADRVTTDSVEGAGSEKVVAVVATAPGRIRFLSGANGLPANNTSFTTTSGTDGFIGFYYKTADLTGAKLSLNLDGGTAGATADMDMSPQVTVLADGAWHLAEFDLDATTGWGAVTSIGGGHAGSVPNNSHTVDSIYIQNIAGNGTILFDFVAKSDGGSIAALVPEPASAALVALGSVSLLARRRRA